MANWLIQDCVASGPAFKSCARHEENWHLGVQLPYRLNQRQPVHSRHLEIGEQQFNAGSDCQNDLVGFESILRFDRVKLVFSSIVFTADRKNGSSSTTRIGIVRLLATKLPIVPVAGELAYYSR